MYKNAPKKMANNAKKDLKMVQKMPKKEKQAQNLCIDASVDLF